MPQFFANNIQAFTALPRLPYVCLAQAVSAKVIGEAEFLRCERDRRPEALSAERLELYGTIIRILEITGHDERRLNGD